MYWVIRNLILNLSDQSPEEIERTKQFALEVVDLLKHNPQCRMPFNKFIPAYHHHFGRQCRVSDYGFSKLLDLFEAIPHVVDVSVDISVFLWAASQHYTFKFLL